MIIVPWPAGLPVKTQDWGINSYDLPFGNAATGASQVKVRGPRRMTCAITSEESLPHDESAQWRQVLFALNGRVNLLAVYDIQQPAPRGTLRGVLAAAQAAGAGAQQLTINAGPAQAGRTLLTGDWIGVQQASASAARQLLHVQADAMVDQAGLITVTLGTPLRQALAAGSGVAWDRPTCLMRATGEKVSWKAQRALKGGFALDLLEAWA